MRLKATAYMGELPVPCVITGLSMQTVWYMSPAETMADHWVGTIELEREQCELLRVELPPDKRVMLAQVPTYNIRLEIGPATSDIRIETTWIKRGFIKRVLARLLDWPKRNTVGLTDITWKDE